MVNLSEDLSELSHDELQYVIDSYLLWAYKTMKQREINIRSWELIGELREQSEIIREGGLQIIGGGS